MPLAIYQLHRPVHPYGIYDVVNLWDVSRWWVDGDAVVGLLDLPGAPTPVVYAVSATADEATLDLLGRLAPMLPDTFVITGPEGLSARLAADFHARWSAPHVKMHLADPTRLPPPSPDVVTLGRDDLDEVEQLFRADPHHGTFFHPGLLDTGCYVGVRDDGLVALAGVHLVDEDLGLAALGNVTTRPDSRRRGLARATVATLCHRLRDAVDLIGLNVRRDNVAARALYERLGFAVVAAYEEAEVVRR